jgi:hypothetical protein
MKEVSKMSNGPFSGKVEIQDIPTSGSPQSTITLDGNTAGIVAGGNGYHGRLALEHAANQETAVLNGMTGDLTLGGNGVDGDLTFRIKDNKTTISLRANTSEIRVGGGGQLGSNGRVVIRDTGESGIVVLDAASGQMALGGGGKQGNVVLFDENASNVMVLSAGSAEIALGGGGKQGHVRLQEGGGLDTVTLDASGFDAVLVRDASGSKRLFAMNRDNATLFVGAHSSDGEGGKPGSIHLRDQNGKDSLVLDGNAGDIHCGNADCAEDFDVSQSADVEPGTVVVIDEEGKLRPNQQAYDHKVAGVISGRPGLILDKKESQPDRLPVALVGKVYCKVDAQYSAIEVADLLTTSPTPGHAMKASDPSRAFGAVIGKALRPLNTGQGLIPILIALQ